MDISSLKTEFFKRYGDSSHPLQIHFAPGRVNLIGEHTDYNGGYVLPCALHFGTYILVRKNGTGQINMATMNFEYSTAIPVSEMVKQDKKWVNYPMGVMDQLIKRGFRMEGMDLLFYGDVPNAAGLSSSASIEMVTATAVNDLLNLKLDMIDLVRLGQKAENEFVGVNCGIMDQFAAGMSRKNHALFLDCSTLEFELIPLLLADYKLIISNTNKRRGLADSKYNERRSECDQSVEYLSHANAIKQLGDIDYTRFVEIQHLIPNETIRRRAKHVVSENQRVLDAVEALKNSDLTKFGELMNQSHDSLRDDYEVTGMELDTLVSEARKIKGVIGSRMTGAGFGGCTVSLVHQDSVDPFINEVGLYYQSKTGLAPDFYVAETGDGACRIE